MGEFRVDLRDIRFVLHEMVKVHELTAFEKYAEYTTDDFDMVLDEAAKFAKAEIYPLQEVADGEGAKLEGGKVLMPPAFHKAYKKFTQNGWNAVGSSMEWGGQGLPMAVALSATEMFIGACPSFNLMPGLSNAASEVIEHVGSDEQKAKYCEKLYTGEWGGTMCLTEPGAGSAVGDIRTNAVKVEDADHYLITGDKLFITAADQDITDNIIHLVLARTPDAPVGIKGLSLFIVPKFRDDGTWNDTAITAMEEKMGIHGSPTCSISFGDEGDCHGWIIGEEGDGIRHMFLMMNEARIGVGLQGAGIGNFAYQVALEYARERIQGTDIASFKDPNAERIAIINHPDVKRMLITMKAYAEGIRALLMVTAGFADRAAFAEKKRDKQRAKHLLEILTPICKAYGSYRGFDITDLAIMVHGGYGYIKEYEVEGMLRDVKIAAIYEGTNGIQALDLLGRKVSGKGGMMFMSFIQWMNDFAKENKDHEALGELVQLLDGYKNTLATVTMELGKIGRKGDAYYPVLHASPYLEMFGDVVMGRLLVEKALIAHGKLEGASEGETRFLDGKIKTAQFFLNNLMRVDQIAAAIRSMDRSALEIEL